MEKLRFFILQYEFKPKLVVYPHLISPAPFISVICGANVFSELQLIYTACMLQGVLLVLLHLSSKLAAPYWAWHSYYVSRFQRNGIVFFFFFF